MSRPGKMEMKMINLYRRSNTGTLTVESSGYAESAQLVADLNLNDGRAYERESLIGWPDDLVEWFGGGESAVGIGMGTTGSRQAEVDALFAA